MIRKIINPNMNARFSISSSFLAWTIVSCAILPRAESAIVTYRAYSPDLGFDFISVIELSETAEIQPSGTFRFHALSASLQSDAGLSSLPLSDYQTAYLDVFGANDPQFVNFSFGFPSSLYVGYSSASIGVGNSGGLVGLGTSDPTDIRVFRGDWDHSSSIGTTFVGAYLLTIDGNQVSPNFRVEIIEVIPESSTTLLGGIGVLGLLHYRRRL